MPTNFPDSLDDETSLPTVVTSGVISSAETNTERGAIKGIEESLIGPPFISASMYDDLAASMLHNAEALSDASGVWTAVGGYQSDTPALDGTNKTEGTYSVECTLSFPAGSGTNGKLYVDLTSPISVGSHTHVLLDSRWVIGSGSDANQAFEFVVADAAGLTGNVVNLEVSASNMPLTATFYTLAVPLGALTQVASVGVRKRSSATGGSSSKRVTWWLDNIRLSDNTGLDLALDSATTVGVVVPPMYTTAGTQRYTDLSTTKTVLDLRPSNAYLSGAGGIHNLREWNLDETGTTDVTDDLQRIWDSLSDGDTLLAPPSAIYLVNNRVYLNTHSRVTFDAQGARFIQTALSEVPMFAVGGYDNTYRGFRIFGRHSLTQTGSQLSTVAGTPTINGTGIELNALDEEVRIPLKSSNSMSHHYGRDHEGYIQFDFTLSDSAQVASDCVITITDHDNVDTYHTETLTLTATPTVYEVKFQPPDIYKRTRVTVKKATATANTITIAQVVSYNHGDYSATYAFNHGFVLVESYGTRIFDCSVETMYGDGICGQDDDSHNTYVRGFLSRCCGRQGVSFNRGYNVTFEDFEVIASGRHDIDLEPETSATEIANVTIRNGRFAYGIEGGYVSTTWARVMNLTMENVEIWTDAGSGSLAWTGGFNGGIIRNLTQRHTGTTDAAVLEMKLRNATIDGAELAGGLELVTASGTEKGGGSVSAGYTIARNIRVRGGTQQERLKVAAPNCRVENFSVIADGLEDDTSTYMLPVNLVSDTTYSGVNLTAEAALMPNTYKGIAAGQLWFPRGLDMLADGILQTRALSSTTTRGNNLAGSSALGSGVTSVAITFPNKSDVANPTSANPSATTDAAGTLAEDTYYYRVAKRSVQTGPTTPLAETSVVIAAPDNAVSIPVIGWIKTDTQVGGLTILRGTTSTGPYTERYDIIPNSDFYGAGHTNLGDRWYIKDLGSTVDTSESGNTVVAGYATSYAVQSGSWAGTDNETGWEADTSYYVIASPSFNCGGWWITNKARSGFTINWVTATGDTNQTMAWMIVR